MHLYAFNDHNMKHFSTNFKRMEIKHESINVKLTFVIKCFCKWKGPCNLCKYIQNQISKKKLFQFIALIVRTCGFKFFCCILDNPNHFYLHLKIVTYFNHFFLVNCNFLVAINLGCTHSTCVLIGLPLLHLWYSISLFKKNTSLGKQWVSTLPIACSDLQIMHCNTHKFTRSTRRPSLTTRKTPIDESMIVKLPQCNLNFYSCKLHNFYCCHIIKFEIQTFNI